MRNFFSFTNSAWSLVFGEQSRYDDDDDDDNCGWLIGWVTTPHPHTSVIYKYRMNFSWLPLLLLLFIAFNERMSVMWMWNGWLAIIKYKYGIWWQIHMVYPGHHHHHHHIIIEKKRFACLVCIILRSGTQPKSQMSNYKSVILNQCAAAL